jgi:MFS-type transporter involved in bile tolerance (Atg22 family)
VDVITLTVATTGIALINSAGNLAGFVGPFIVGCIKDATGSSNVGLYVIAVSLVFGARVVLSLSRQSVDR